MERHRRLPPWVALALAALLGAGATWLVLGRRADGPAVPGASDETEALRAQVARLERELEAARTAPRLVEGLASPPAPTEDARRVALEKELADVRRRLDEAIAERDEARAAPRPLRVLPGSEADAALLGGPGVAFSQAPLGTLAPADLQEIERILASGREDERRAAYQRLARASNAEALPLLEEALARDDVGPFAPALMQRAAALKDRAWSAAQATGAPDTPIAGDNATAWASKQGDMGEVTLDLDFAAPVLVDEVRVHETFNPGAIVRILAFERGRGWETLWEGVAAVEEAPRWFTPPLRRAAFATGTIRLVLDTDRVAGWNEVDAVELVGEGRRQWATAARASSSYAD